MGEFLYFLRIWLKKSLSRTRHYGQFGDAKQLVQKVTETIGAG